MNNNRITLLNEDFKDFSIGDFPFDAEHSAMGEYHLYPNKGYCGAWFDPVCNYTYRGPSWIITEENGEHFLEQMRVETTNPHKTYPTLAAGDFNWKNYTVSAKMRIFNTSGDAGICFNYQNSLNVLVLLLREQKLMLVYRHKCEEKILAQADCAFDCDSFYILKAICDGSNVKCFVNGELKIEYSDELIARGGKIAVTASVPAQFTDIAVCVSEQTKREIDQRISEIKKRDDERQSKYPKMKLFKKLDLKNFGTGRQIRFGHLTGTKEWHIVLAQCQKRVFKDAYAHISCLTAIDLNGNILWQLGEPSENESFAKLTADVPLQVYDIDGDGIDEVITARNFELLILDGRTGMVKKKCKTPFSDEENSTLIGVPFNRYAFDRLNPDGIRIANFSGKSRPSDILLKDRYCRVYALNSDLELMWKFRNNKNTGHFPYAFDIDGDGKDELFCGYNLIDHDGSLIWTLPIEDDHTDEIIVGRLNPQSDKGCFGLVSGTQGFILADFDGNIIKQDFIGHAQRISTGNYRPNVDGYDICTTNYWGHQGIIYFYNCKGEPVWEKETGLNGNIIAPVNWVGDGTDLILLNADAKYGGLMDGDGNIVVKFPDDDNHPVLCAEAIDIAGDARDEIIVWDKNTMYIYTQDNTIDGEVYKPVKYPHYNSSNYRGEYSFPDKSYIFEK